MRELDAESLEVKVLAGASNILFEHFDTIEIVCTRMDGEKTQMFCTGRGNQFARISSLEKRVSNLWDGDCEEDDED